MAFEFRPLTPDLWGDLVELFGARGACGGCWCMWWRLARSRFVEQKGAANQRAFRRVVEQGPPPGLIAYASGRPVGWCALAPRESYPALGRSRILAPVDAEPAWAVTCFFVARPWRRKGLSVRLLKAAAAYARSQGARLLEGFPVDPGAGAMPDAFAWTGLASAFEKAGFREAARRSRTRPIMRRALARQRQAAQARPARVS